ncbi:MAG: ECF transporter S component [Eubacterium sp.]|nr:ECF transporter S component [Eubacterium sp.]
MNENTKKIAGLGLLTAIVVVLQLLGAFIRFGPFSISLVLIPIVVGAALYGKMAGAWLGLAFGVAVLASGDAGAFLAVNPVGTVATVLLKGLLAGLLAGVCYSLIEKKNKVFATIMSAIICPIVNTGVFLIGCRLFFFDTIKEWAGGTDVLVYMVTGLVGFNFLFELGANLILSPTIIKLVSLGRKENK